MSSIHEMVTVGFNDMLTILGITQEEFNNSIRGNPRAVLPAPLIIKWEEWLWSEAALQQYQAEKKYIEELRADVTRLTEQLRESEALHQKGQQKPYMSPAPATEIEILKARMNVLEQTVHGLQRANRPYNSLGYGNPGSEGYGHPGYPMPAFPPFMMEPVTFDTLGVFGPKGMDADPSWQRMIDTGSIQQNDLDYLKSVLNTEDGKWDITQSPDLFINAIKSGVLDNERLTSQERVTIMNIANRITQVLSSNAYLLARSHARR